MATIAEQLTSLANTKTAIKQAIVNKGVAVADDTPFSGYAAKIGEISGGGGTPATKFGASVDSFIGDVDENGALSKPTVQTEFNFAGVKEISYEALEYFLYNKDLRFTLNMDSVESIMSYGLTYAFAGSGCLGFSFGSLKTVKSYGMRQAFYSCSGVTRAIFSSLITVGDNGFDSAFEGCRNLEVAEFPLLTTIGSNGFVYALRWAKIKTLSFPSLVDVKTNSFGTVAFGCDQLSEIHFRADMQATIEAMSGYSSKFGATNATIYFDL